MYAYFVPSNHHFTKFHFTQILGMPLLCITLPRKCFPGTMDRIHCILHRQGIHRLFNMPFGRQDNFLPPLNETRGLWLSHIEEVVSAILIQKGFSPERSTVEICGDYFSPTAEQIICSLSSLVQYLILSLPVPDAFLWQLQTEWGIVPRLGRGQISISLSPSFDGADLSLGVARPIVSGLTLVMPGLIPPPGCPTLPLLAALAAQGRIDPKSLTIQGDFT